MPVKEIYELMVELLEQGESFVLATIFSSAGSAPRTAGAYMLLRADGSSAGTVGGGLLEAQVQRMAPHLFEQKKSLVMHFSLTGQDASVLEMICGGEVDVLADYIDAANESYLQIFKELLAAMKNHRKAWQVLTLPDEAGEFGGTQRCLVKAQDPTVQGWGIAAVGGAGCAEFPEALVQEVMAQPEVSGTQYPVVVTLKGKRLLVEPAVHFGAVYLMGGGHISQKLAPLVRMIGFETIVVDDRPDYVSAERFPTADQRVLVESFDQALTKFKLDDASFIVIVTRGHLHDKTVLAQALRSPAAYIGMIGSLRKRDLIYEELEGEGFAREHFQRVHAPIGLRVGAESPEEIAIAIAGELIQVRSKRK
ncbi:MAG: XdhC family protein [Anaerolineaceae bacterium]|nr:XdhC family protein [Anaerolineaceae bacterium]